MKPLHKFHIPQKCANYKTAMREAKNFDSSSKTYHVKFNFLNTDFITLFTLLVLHKEGNVVLFVNSL